MSMAVNLDNNGHDHATSIIGMLWDESNQAGVGTSECNAC